jgi:glutamate 5-kinase
VNENDAVAVEEILVGDNDQLAVMVAGMVSAERLVFLTSVDGVYDGDPSLPSSKKVPEIPSPSALRRYLPQGKSLLGRGGIHGKLLAGEKAQKLGIETIIASGNEKNVLIRLFQGEKVGSRIPGSSHPIKARKFWIRYALHPKGEIVVDKGAEIALRERGKSLLPSGVLDVHGSFSPGDPVRIVSVEGNPVAYGIVEYSAEEIRKIQGKKTKEIVPILGYKRTDEIVHRDDLVLEKDSTDPVAITS